MECFLECGFAADSQNLMTKTELKCVPYLAPNIYCLDINIHLFIDYKSAIQFKTEIATFRFFETISWAAHFNHWYHDNNFNARNYNLKMRSKLLKTNGTNWLDLLFACKCAATCSQYAEWRMASLLSDNCMYSEMDKFSRLMDDPNIPLTLQCSHIPLIQLDKMFCKVNLCGKRKTKRLMRLHHSQLGTAWDVVWLASKCDT